MSSSKDDLPLFRLTKILKLQPLPPHSQIVALDTLESSVYCGYSDGWLRIFDSTLLTGKPTASVRVPQSVAIRSIHILASSSLLAVLLADGLLVFHELSDLRPATSLHPQQSSSSTAASTALPTIKHCLQCNVNAGRDKLLLVRRRTIELFQVSSGRQFTPLFQHDYYATATVRRIIQFAVVSNGGTIAFADQQSYHLMIPPSTASIPLFPFQNDNSGSQMSPLPLISAVGDDEFLLTMPPANQQSKAIGIFINANGEPVRGTLEWPSYPAAICFANPYIVSLLRTNTTEDGVNQMEMAVYSLLDLSLKQTILMSADDGKLFCTFGYRDLMHQPLPPESPADSIPSFGALVAADNAGAVMSNVIYLNNRGAYALQLLSDAQQIVEMLKRQRLEGAINLVQNIEDSGESIEHLRREIGWIGWALLMRGDFKRAFEQFKRGTLGDPRWLDFVIYGSDEVIIPADGPVPLCPLNYIISGNVEALKRLAFEYLLDRSLAADNHEQHCNTVLLKLANDLHKPEMQQLILDTRRLANFDNCEKYFRDTKSDYALLLLYRRTGAVSKALLLWRQMLQLRGDEKDPRFCSDPDELIDFLHQSVKDTSTYLECTEWLLGLDPGVLEKLFGQVDFCVQQYKLRPRDILEFLGNHKRSELKAKYLSTILLDHDPQSQKTFAQTGDLPELQNIYLQLLLTDINSVDVIEKLNEEFSDSNSSQSPITFKEFLQSRDIAAARKRLDLIRLLERIQLADDALNEAASQLTDKHLFVESAIVYGKLSQHDQVLRILLERMYDFASAERYCASLPNIADRQKLFNQLLRIYRSAPNNSADLVNHLLNTRPSSFPLTQTISELLGSQSAESLRTFLTSGVLYTAISRWTVAVVKELARARLTAARSRYAQMQQTGRVRLDCDDEAVYYCNICGKRIDKQCAVGVRYRQLSSGEQSTGSLRIESIVHQQCIDPS